MKIQGEMNLLLGKFDHKENVQKISSEKGFFGGAFKLLACFSAVIPHPVDSASVASSFVESIRPIETSIEWTQKTGRAGGYELREISEISPRDIAALEREEWIQELKDKALAFVETDFSEHREQRLDYLLQVIDTPRFQENPRQYILDWIDRRGLTKEYRFVEDAALAFFRSEFNIQTWPNDYDCGM